MILLHQKPSAERPRAGEHGGFGQTGTSLCIYLEGVHLLQYKILGVTCSSQQGDSGTLCVSSHGSNSSTECHLVCGTYFGLELVGRLLWRVQTLHCSVFFAANVCHGPMLLLLYFPPEYVATHVVNSTWMVEQLCYGHGNLDGFFHAADFPLLLFARFGRCSSRWMAGIYHFSSECHWELCTEAWSILAMVILILPQPFFCGIWWTFPTSQWEVNSIHSHHNKTFFSTSRFKIAFKKYQQDNKTRPMVLPRFNTASCMFQGTRCWCSMHWAWSSWCVVLCAAKAIASCRTYWDGTPSWADLKQWWRSCTPHPSWVLSCNFRLHWPWYRWDWAFISTLFTLWQSLWNIFSFTIWPNSNLRGCTNYTMRFNHSIVLCIWSTIFAKGSIPPLQLLVSGKYGWMVARFSSATHSLVCPTSFSIQTHAVPMWLRTVCGLINLAFSGIPSIMWRTAMCMQSMSLVTMTKSSRGTWSSTGSDYNAHPLSGIHSSQI